MRIKTFFSVIPLAVLLIAGVAAPTVTQANDFGYVRDDHDDRKGHRRSEHNSYGERKHYPEHNWHRHYWDNYYPWPIYYYTRPFGLYYAPPSYIPPPRYYTPYYPPSYYSPPYSYGYSGPSFYFEYSRYNLTGARA